MPQHASKHTCTVSITQHTDEESLTNRPIAETSEISPQRHLHSWCMQTHTHTHTHGTKKQQIRVPELLSS
jgi:hypothetical protein